MRCRVVMPFILLSVMLLGLAGCSSNKGKIEGTKWVTTGGKLKNGANVPPGALIITFGNDGSLTWQNSDETLSGTYSLGMGSRITFHFTKEVQGFKSHMANATVDGDKLTMSDNAGELVFAKAK